MVVILIFVSQIFAQSPDFSVTINVMGGVGSYDLTIGFSPDATDGYDDGIDQYAPPQPPSPAFDAALFWENDRYYTQIVNGDSLDLIEHVWNIQLQYPEDNLITLSWDNGCLSVLGTFTLQDASGGNLVSVDMTTVDSLVLDNPSLNTLKLKVTPKEYSPETPPEGFDFTPNPASGTFIGTVTINGQNAEECDWIAAFDENGNCAGSAILVLNDDLAWINIPIYGDDSTTPDVDEGMNPGENFVLKLWDVSSGLILEYPISFDCWSNQNGAPMPNCGGIDEIYNFFYSSFFSVSLLIEPEGSGIVSGSGNYFENAIVTVTATANDGYTFVNWTEDGIEISAEASYNFTIIESRNLVANFREIVYTGPTAGFIYNADNLEVTFTDRSVAGDGDITNWNWDFGDDSTSTERNPSHAYFGAGNYFVKLVVTDEYGMINERTEFISVATDELLLPVNYPNPFKDNTTIIFEISIPSIVKIDVFNLLGKKVHSLISTYVNEEVNRVVWDGKNNRGKLVRSGLYFYRIQTDNEIQTGKMVVIR